MKNNVIVNFRKDKKFSKKGSIIEECCVYIVLLI